MSLQLVKMTGIQTRKKNCLPVFTFLYSHTHSYFISCNFFVLLVATTSRLSKSRSIMFEKPTGIIGSADADALMAATQSALTKLEPIVAMDGADSFSALVQLLKVAKKDDILSAFEQIMSGSSGYENTEVPEYVDKIMKILCTI